jgi:hypothetical protein
LLWFGSVRRRALDGERSRPVQVPWLLWRVRRARFPGARGSCTLCAVSLWLASRGNPRYQSKGAEKSHWRLAIRVPAKKKWRPGRG